MQILSKKLLYLGYYTFSLFFCWRGILLFYFSDDEFESFRDVFVVSRRGFCEHAIPFLGKRFAFLQPHLSTELGWSRYSYTFACVDLICFQRDIWAPNRFPVISFASPDNTVWFRILSLIILTISRDDREVTEYTNKYPWIPIECLEFRMLYSSYGHSALYGESGILVQRYQ